MTFSTTLIYIYCTSSIGNLNLGCLHLVACVRSWSGGGGGGFIPSTKCYYHRSFTIYYYLNFYMSRSYDHLKAEIYLLGYTRLTTDPLFLEYS
jgi:hypothetical protein